MSTLANNWTSHLDLMYCCCMNAQINTHFTAYVLQHPCDSFFMSEQSPGSYFSQRAAGDELFIQFDQTKHYCSLSTFLNEYRARAVAK